MLRKIITLFSNFLTAFLSYQILETISFKIIINFKGGSTEQNQIYICMYVYLIIYLDIYLCVSVCISHY